MITKLKIKNFKSHLDTDLEVKPLTVLTGINSSGKSSVLQSLLLLRQSCKKGRLKTGLDLNAPLCDIGKGADALYRLASDETIAFTFEIDGKNTFNYIFDAEDRYGDTFLPRLGKMDLLEIITPPLFSHKFQYISSARWASLNLYPMDSYAVETEKQISLNYGQGELVAHFLEYYGRHRDFKVKSDKLLHPNNKSTDLLDQVIEWEREISPRITIKSEKKADKVSIEYGYKGMGESKPIENLQSKNIGYGVSYSLSIIVALLAAEPDDLLLLENPEAHLHPAGQAKLAELICLAAQSGIQIIVETHSDHIINGILVQCKNFEDKQKGISKDNVSVYYLDMDGEKHCSVAEKINILEGGKIDKQPKGFFDQIEHDLEIIMGF
jgi:predicted ATPase